MEVAIREEVLDMVSIDNIRTLEQADEILEACKASDEDVVETYVQNAITRGAVYHKLTQVDDGGLGLFNADIGERYNISRQSVDNYVNIFNNKNILYSCQHDSMELKPTLRSLLDTIKKDPENVAKMIEYRISSRGINSEIANTVSEYMENANEDIRFLFSTKSRVALGRLATAIKEEDEVKILNIIKLDGDSEKNADIEHTKRDLADENKELKRQISELTEENEMLKRRNKFLIDSYKLSDVKRFLNRAINNESKLRRFKPEMQEAMDVLGVDATVDASKLKKAYRQKVAVHHSDITGDDELFRKIIEANKLVKEFIEGL